VLNAAVTRANAERYSEFLCGRRKTFLKLDPKYFTVRHLPGEAHALRLLLVGNEQPACTFK
jgi:hypothetical protein